MIKVLKINKEKNRVKSYTCMDGDKEFELSKDELVELIRDKQVSNATAYKFEGITSVRIVDKKKMEERRKVVTLYKLVHEAKKRGIKEFDLSDFVVDTETMIVTKKGLDD